MLACLVYCINVEMCLPVWYIASTLKCFFRNVCPNDCLLRPRCVQSALKVMVSHVTNVLMEAMPRPNPEIVTKATLESVGYQLITGLQRVCVGDNVYFRNKTVVFLQ